MLRRLGAALIRAYQRHLSPRKGFLCAYGELHEAGTCSSIGLHIMEDQGFLAFFRQMPLQFDACRAAAAVLSEETPKQREERRRRKRQEDGRNCSGIDDCDLPCDFSEIAICESVGSGIECRNCEFGSCD